jgi:hypothetical protein
MAPMLEELAPKLEGKMASKLIWKRTF